MNSRDRILETLLFGKPDRVPLSPGGPRESTLRAWPGAEVCLADLATIDLDLAALERDYERPEPRSGLDVRIG